MCATIISSITVLQDDHSGLAELKLGGAIYVLGVVFFKLDGRVPLAHAIWHLFVVLAAFIHYYAVLTYLILPSDPPEAEDWGRGEGECDALTSSECPAL